MTAMLESRRLDDAADAVTETEDEDVADAEAARCFRADVLSVETASKENDDAFGEKRDVGDANLAESTACDLVPIDVRAAALAIESESSADSIARAPLADAADAARALAASPNPRSAYSTPAFGCSALRLQLRAVSVLVDTQRRKHARRLAELRERHVEADVRRAAEAHLLSFAEDRKRVARDAEEEKAARSDRRRRRRWEPPGGGVFLGAGASARSHNVHVRSRVVPALRPARASNDDEDALDDPWEVRVYAAC